MANQKQVEILKQGAKVWNKWRRANPPPEGGYDFRKAKLIRANLAKVDLTGADLSGANLSEADLTNANLWAANLTNANLRGARLTGANLWKAILNDADLRKADLRKTNLLEALLFFAQLHEADLTDSILGESTLTAAKLTRAKLIRAKLWQAILTDANFTKADLTGADLSGADLAGADLTGANLRHVNLSNSNLVRTKIDKANISKSRVYGVNVWDLKGEFNEQKDLIITPGLESLITVDNIKIAQFVYLILNNPEIRNVINTLTSKTVLILGRFADDRRKAILDALRNKLRAFNLLPIVFDFDRPIDRNITETVKTLAGISYFVIADITSPKSSPLELQAIVPDYQIPVVPIIQAKEFPFSMINDLRTQHIGLLDPLTYNSKEELIKVLKSAIIDPAIEKHNKLRLIKAQKPRIRSAKDFLRKEME